MFVGRVNKILFLGVSRIKKVKNHCSKLYPYHPVWRFSSRHVVQPVVNLLIDGLSHQRLCQMNDEVEVESKVADIVVLEIQFN
jgi:hypothetical protein